METKTCTGCEDATQYQDGLCFDCSAWRKAVEDERAAEAAADWAADSAMERDRDDSR